MTARFFFGSPKQQREAFRTRREANEAAHIERMRRMNEAFAEACEALRAQMSVLPVPPRVEMRTDFQKDRDDTDSHYGWPED